MVSIGRLKNTYNEIVNELLFEKEEAVRIAQAYKSELERIVISDDDIEHLHNTVAHLLDLFKAIQMSSVNPSDDDKKRQIESQM